MTPEEWSAALILEASKDAMLDSLPAPFLRDRITVMVRSATEEARQEERRQCLMVAVQVNVFGNAGDDMIFKTRETIANAIRQRGEK